MKRHLLLPGVLIAASLGLTACDNPAAGILSTARTGECYAVTGKDSLGQPKLIRTECPTAEALPSKPVQAVAAPAQCAAPAAPVAPPCAAAAPSYSAPAHAYRPARRTARKVWSRWTRRGDDRVAISHEVIPPSGYDYPKPSDTELAGGYSYRHSETYVSPPPAPLPPVYAPPPPPPPPPPPVYAERRYEGERRETESYSSRSSASYASSSSSRRKKCNCSRDREHLVYEEYDRADGYLVWQGKARR